jgi:uncharacterized protein YjiS (DUF1127 family)
MIGLVGMICLFAGCAIGWLLRSEDVWALQRRNDELLDDLDTAVRDIGAMLSKPNHPAGQRIRLVR